MRRMLSLVVALAAIVTCVLGYSAPAAAQDEAMPEGVSLEFLAFALGVTVPESSDQVVLFRMTLAPGAAFPLEPEQGSVALAEVERGELTTTVDGEIQASRAGAALGEEETLPANASFTLAAGDSALYPADLTGEVSNATDEEVSLLILEVVASEMEGGGEMPALPEGITVELLSVGEVPPLQEDGAAFALTRVTYEPGASPGSEELPGTEAPVVTEVSVVEAGAFVLAAAEGPPITIYRGLREAIAENGEPVIETIEPGAELEVVAGDSAYFPAGSISAARNDGDVDAVALLGFVMPAAAMME